MNFSKVFISVVFSIFGWIRFRNLASLRLYAENDLGNGIEDTAIRHLHFHRIHPEAQRILGNSCIPVVSLERLNFQSVSLSSLQPVVSLQRLPCQKQAELCDNVSLNISEQVRSWRSKHFHVQQR